MAPERPVGDDLGEVEALGLEPGPRSAVSRSTLLALEGGLDLAPGLVQGLAGVLAQLGVELAQTATDAPEVGGLAKSRGSTAAKARVSPASAMAAAQRCGAAAISFTTLIRAGG